MDMLREEIDASKLVKTNSSLIFYDEIVTSITHQW